jgi:N-dimethylarginine dimethylaminohydrolase
MASGTQSDVGRIERILLKHARDAFRDDALIAAQWRELNYPSPPDFVRATREYDRLVSLFDGWGIEVLFVPADPEVGLDSIYVRDAAVLSDRGAILCNMGKRARSSEPRALEPVLREAGVPILGAIEGQGRLEGGDVAWLGPGTLAVGRGYRTNDEGIEQLRSLLGDAIDDLIVVPLPHGKGPDDVFHLMSILSPIDLDLALVYSPLMPVPFRETLLERGIRLVEVPDEEFESMGCNVLAVAPRRCLMLEGNDRTRSRLERAGAEVHVFEGEQISAKGAGGPTCLTRPLLREV